MSISKRLEEARRGFARGDLSASAAAHDPARIAEAAHEEHGGAAQAYLDAMVYGALDGIITTFAIVSGVAGADLGARVVLIMGLANEFADGFSMATGAFLSARSEREVYDRERQREGWEVEHFPDGEKAELFELYRQQGYDEQDARRLVEIKSRDPKLWVDAMMIEELGLLREERRPLNIALATFVSFALSGSVPLLVYVAGLFVPIAPRTAFFASAGMSALALFGLGAAKVLVTKLNPIRSGLEMLAVGGLAGIVAFVFGALLKGIGS